MWLECIGMISGCYKEVYIYNIIDFLITFPYILHFYIIYLLFCSSSPTSLFIFLVFSFLFMLFLCNIANMLKEYSRSCRHGDIIMSRLSYGARCTAR